MRFYTTERLGPKRSKTPEGYLLCEDVPLARTGIMIYGPKDGLPIKPKPGDERITVHRLPEDVFSAISLASINGKSLVDDHPEDDVIPTTWAKLTKGIIFNAHRGTGAQDDLTIGDILVTDPETIEMVMDNEKVEISLGYDADYEQTGPGEGVQKNQIINHAALVIDGRCGPRCKIGDSATHKEPTRMSKFGAALHRAFKAKDAAEVEKIEQELAGGEEGGAGGEHHVHVHLPSGGGAPAAKEIKDEGGATPLPAAAAAAGGGDRMSAIEATLAAICAKLGIDPNGGAGGGEGTDDAKRARDAETERARLEVEKAAKDKARDDETIEGALEMEAPPGTEDKARKSKDSSYLADAYEMVVSQIEIIAPGARVPTFDSADRPAVSYSKICGMRTETLAAAYQRVPELAAFMDRTNGGRRPTFDRMTCDAARVMIAAVAGEAGRRNNAGTDQGGGTFGTFAARAGTLGGGGVKGKIMTPADLNKIAREMYKA